MTALYALGKSFLVGVLLAGCGMFVFKRFAQVGYGCIFGGFLCLWSGAFEFAREVLALKVGERALLLYSCFLAAVGAYFVGQRIKLALKLKRPVVYKF